MALPLTLIILKGNKIEENLHKLLKNIIIKNINDEVYNEMKKEKHVKVPIKKVTFTKALTKLIFTKILK